MTGDISALLPICVSRNSISLFNHEPHNAGELSKPSSPELSVKLRKKDLFKKEWRAQWAGRAARPGSLRGCVTSFQ